MLVDDFRQDYTTNVDILKARLKTARQQLNQDTFASLCDDPTFAQRVYRAFPHLVEQIVFTSFLEILNDANLRWELRKSKPATADDALALAMDLNSFVEIENGAPSTSKMAEISVNAISLETPGPSTKECGDEFNRTPTDEFKNAMLKPNQDISRQRSSTPCRNQRSRYKSTNARGTRTARFQDNSNEGGNDNRQDNNRRGLNCQKSIPNLPKSIQISSRGPC